MVSLIREQGFEALTVQHIIDRANVGRSTFYAHFKSKEDLLTGSVEMTSAATKRRQLIPARWGARMEAGRDPVPPRVWSPAEFAAVIARTDVK